MTLHVQYITILFFIIPGTVPDFHDYDPFSAKESTKRCTHVRHRGVNVMECYKLGLEEIPQNLRTDTQVLNAVGNLIEYLYKDSFKNYTHLKQLNLDVNRISAVQKGTFAPLKELEVISLSRNFLKRVPPGILQLPKLRKLFFNKNELIGGGGFEDAPPRKTLEFLSLAYCSLKEFPSLGMYSNLLELNVSGNDIQRILPQQLAPMCQLHSLDISRNPNLFYMNRGNGCDCHLLDSWIADTNIILQRGYRLNCIPTLHDPTHCGNMTEATMIYDTCISTVTAQNGFLQLQESWVPIVIILSITPVAVTLLFCLAIRYQKRKSRKSNAKVNSDYDANDPSET